MAFPAFRPDEDLDLRQDLMAAAALGPCQAQHREMLIAPEKETAFWDCTGDLGSDVLTRWGSRVAPDGSTYYYDRSSRASQWERPAILKKTIEDGLELARSGSDYTKARPWEVCEILHVAHMMCMQKKGARCEGTRVKFAKCLKQHLPSRQG
eukprot:TRINITY_DN1683_c0_g2_i1.p1 TRINITY_DN1683_c0_g2~~TRINITY_DN1683_c0_g2_i1.p1  ORF type:complete len:175 (+),score=31.25 TRINITY_DN1683_c0_g2_i1:71-526(+)